MDQTFDTLVEQALAAVPDYKRFLTVDELDHSSERLAAEYPGAVSLVPLGRSTGGHPISVVVIGPRKPGPVLPMPDGTRAALLFGCPHPNEPIGAMMLEFLSDYLARHPDVVRHLGYTWYIVKCADPDGAKLNEGWFPGPFTLRNYATNFYRPASHEQVEWTFPIDYKTLHFDSPIPETQALMKIIDEVKPAFMYSLHNAGFGGVYFYISKPYQELCPVLQGEAARQTLPLALGEPEMPYAVKLADAVYVMPSSKDSYEFLAAHTRRDPATMITGGTSSDDYARSVADTFTLVCEMPYFYDPRIDDLRPSDVSRRTVVLEGLDRAAQAYDFLKGKYETMKDLLSGPSRFRTAIENYLRTWPHNAEAQRDWAKTSPELERPATVAEVFSNNQVNKFYRLLMLGMAARLAALEIGKGGGATTDPAVARLAKVRDEVLAELDRRNTELEAELNYEVIPIRKLVSVQLATGLRAAEFVARKNG
ncbi:MAG: M14 family zinc carboxypeptidase [Bacillota bacterium]